MKRSVVVSLGSLLVSASAFADDAAVQRGKAVFLDRDLGHCVLCHQVASLEIPFQGNIGPDLSSVASRLTADMMRAKVIDPTVDNPETTMPAYHRTDNLRQVASEYTGYPILDAEQFADLLAYLDTLREDT